MSHDVDLRAGEGILPQKIRAVPSLLTKRLPLPPTRAVPPAPQQGTQRAGTGRWSPTPVTSGVGTSQRCSEDQMLLGRHP